LNILAKFGIIIIATEVADSGAPHSPAPNRLLP
jgi:hypothetical protein